MGYSNLLAEDKRLVTYRPRLNEVTGSVTATVLLQQIIFHADNKGNRPFYKFRAPCGHRLYKKGDSWTEELGFSPAEFDTARSKIATRVKKGDSKTEALKGETANHLVIYWTDASRVTWYMLNVDLLNKILAKLYADSRNSNYQNEESPNSESQDSGNTRKLGEQELPLSETTTEITIEDTEKTKVVLSEKTEADFPKTPAPPAPSPGGVDERAVIDSIATDFLNNTAPEDLQRVTEAKQAEAGNYADPATFTLADRLITAACARLGRSEPTGKKHHNAVAFFKKALGDEGLLQDDVDMLEQAVKDWLNPEGEYAFFLSQYDLNPRHELALRHFGIMLSKAKAQPVKPDRYARTVAHADKSQKALAERMAARKKPIEGDFVWEQAKREIALQMTKATFETWVKDTYGLPQQDGIYTVVVPDERARDWLESRLKTTARRTLVGILGEQVEVRFEVEG